MNMRVLVIEDEPKMALTLQAFLQENEIEADLVHSAEEGQVNIYSKKYDLIVSDIVMSGMSGLDLVKKMRSENNLTPLLMISALGDTDDKINGLQSGADDYLPKPFDLNELLARILAIHRRTKSKLIDNDLLEFESLQLNLNTLEVTREKKQIILTPKEFNLLVYFVKNKNRVIPKLELLEQIWGLGAEINTNVVEVYVNYLRRKIDKNFGEKFLHTHFGIGYVLTKKTGTES